MNVPKKVDKVIQFQKFSCLALTLFNALITGNKNESLFDCWYACWTGEAKREYTFFIERTFFLTSEFSDLGWAYPVFSQSLAQQVRDNSWPVFFKTTCIVWVNLQEVAGGKNRLLLLLEAVKFTGYRLIRRTLLICECGLYACLYSSPTSLVNMNKIRNNVCPILCLLG